MSYIYMCGWINQEVDRGKHRIKQLLSNPPDTKNHRRNKEYSLDETRGTIATLSLTRPRSISKHSIFMYICILLYVLSVASRANRLS